MIQISSDIGGFSLAESDMMRRAMGKKKTKLMASYKIQFIKGAKSKKVPEKVASELFELLEKFADYGFNKSHSVAYAMIAYQTAWLKHYYPIEFLTANISSNINDTDNVVKLINDGKRMGISINPPNINLSDADFTILDDTTMQYGLAAIKNVGYKASIQIANYRKKNGNYQNIFDLATSNTQQINKKVIESLILVGACQCLDKNRAELFNCLEQIISFSSKFYKNQNRNQESLFNSKNDSKVYYPLIEPCEPWPTEKELKHEKELLGFYLSSNPLEKYEEDLIELSTIDSNGCNIFNNEQVGTGGIISDLNLRYDKQGNQWAIISLDTLFGSLQVYVFHTTYIDYADLLTEDKIIFIKGKISNQSDNKKISQIIANKIYGISNLRNKLTQYINIKIDHAIVKEDKLNTLFDLSKKESGNTPFIFHMMTSQSRYQKVLDNKLLIDHSHETLLKIRSIFGNKNVWLS